MTTTLADELPEEQARALERLRTTHRRRLAARDAYAAALADEDDATHACRVARIPWAPIAAELGVSEVQAYRKARATGRVLPTF